MDYLVYDTEEEALAAERIVFNFGKLLAKNSGYLTNGAIHGLKNGVSDETTAITDKWSVVQQRLDGKWVILHPKYHSAAKDPLLLSGLMDSVGDVVIEPIGSDWFETKEV